MLYKHGYMRSIFVFVMWLRLFNPVIEGILQSVKQSKEGQNGFSVGNL